MYFYVLTQNYFSGSENNSLSGMEEAVLSLPYASLFLFFFFGK
jgi:hypothetical protein